MQPLLFVCMDPLMCPYILINLIIFFKCTVFALRWRLFRFTYGEKLFSTILHGHKRTLPDYGQSAFANADFSGSIRKTRAPQDQQIRSSLDWIPS